MPDGSQLSDEIISKIRKLLESEIKEIKSISEQRSNTNQESISLHSTFEPFHSEERIETKEEEEENLQPNVNLNQTEISSETENQTFKDDKKISPENKEKLEKVFIEIFPNNQVKKGRPLESSIVRKTQNRPVSMMKLSRNGGIENNLSRKEIARPSWRSELSEKKQQTENHKSSESIMYLKISSSSQEPESNVTKLVQESEKLPTLVALVQQSSEASRIKFKDVKAEREKRPIENIQGKSKDEAIQSREEDLIEAANFGMQAMNDLYYIKEPKLYSMGK